MRAQTVSENLNFNREGTPYEKLGIGKNGIKRALLNNPPPEVDSMFWDDARSWFELNVPSEFLEDLEYNESDPLSPRDYYGFDDDFYLEEHDEIDYDEFHNDFKRTGKTKSKPNKNRASTFRWEEGALPDGTKVIKWSSGLTSGYIAHKDWLK